jgi:hypothetical protein
MMTDENQDWQNLARLASQELDPDRLIELVRQLNSALEKNEEGPDPLLPHPSHSNPKDCKVGGCA